MAVIGGNSGRRDSGSDAWPAGPSDHTDELARELNDTWDASEPTFDVDKFVETLSRETDGGALTHNDATMWLDWLRGLPKIT